ncbi:MAG: FtsW/RodA/SpoVE family cell cycle protein, partial [Gammaproteobacteria bacterium]|nr:FtsW/RodA/SpoVE family cell cycle protein [Gammaproteobacteria bacterium]
MIDHLHARLPAWPDLRLGLDASLLAAAVSLLAWGLVMVASASVAAGETASGSALQFFWRQLLFVMLGGGLATALWCVPMAFWARTTWLMFGGAVALLLMDGDRMGRMLAGDPEWAITYRDSFHPRVRDGFDRKADQQPRLKQYGNE